MELQTTVDPLRQTTYVCSSSLPDILSDYPSQSLNRDVWLACMLMNRYITYYSHLHHFLKTNYGSHHFENYYMLLALIRISTVFPLSLRKIEDKDVETIFKFSLIRFNFRDQVEKELGELSSGMLLMYFLN